MLRSFLTRRRPLETVVQMQNNRDVRYWTQRLSVSAHALGLAVQAVGTNAHDVERFIERARGRCTLAGSASAAGSADARAIDAVLPTVPAEDGGELLRLQYVSRAAVDLEQGTVQAIVAWSMNYNAASGITGALVFTGRHFSQVLEGPTSTVQSLMASIRRDARHQDIRMLSEASILKRRFSDWSMVLVDDSGLQNLLEELWWSHRLDPERAARLVQHLLHELRMDGVRPPPAEALPQQ